MGCCLCCEDKKNRSRRGDDDDEEKQLVELKKVPGRFVSVREKMLKPQRGPSLAEGKWTDNVFTPRAVEEHGYGPVKGGIEWHRLTDIPGFSVGDAIIPDNVLPTDVKQGKLGDCPFVVSAVVAAKSQAVLRKVFEKCTETITEQGCYTIQFWKDSKWTSILVDDLIPCHKTNTSPITPAFTRCKRGSPWPLLLEKAYAKFYGSYAAINSGNIAESLYDLTGLPVEGINIKEGKDTDLGEVCTQIYEYTEEHALITAGMPPGRVRHARLPNGLVTGHAYAVLDVFFGDNETMMVEVYNPWGTGGWVGDETRDGGVFTIPAREFVKSFDVINVCRVEMVGVVPYTIRGTFTEKNSGGSRGFVSFRHNPVFLLTPLTDAPSRVQLVVSHHDQRGYVKPGTISYNPIGFTVVRPRGSDISPASLLPNCYDVTHGMTFWNKREVALDVELPPLQQMAHLCVISTYYPGIFCEFAASFYCSNVEVKELDWVTLRRATLRGSWDATQKHYVLKSPVQCKVFVFLCQGASGCLLRNVSSFPPMFYSKKTVRRVGRSRAKSPTDFPGTVGKHEIRIEVSGRKPQRYSTQTEICEIISIPADTEVKLTPKVRGLEVDADPVPFEISVYSHCTSVTLTPAREEGRIHADWKSTNHNSVSYKNQ